MMEDLTDALVVAAFGAVLACLGYCGKLIVELAQRTLDKRSMRMSRLVELQSLLLASRSVYRAQVVLRNKLSPEIKNSNPNLRGRPYDEVLAEGYRSLSDRQKLDHGLIRSYTIKALLPLNNSMAEWLTKDDFFKSLPDDLGSALRTLEAHLVLWRAKYEFSIPDKPERALVYLADERNQGVGFPKGIEKLLLKKTGTSAVVDEKSDLRGAESDAITSPEVTSEQEVRPLEAPDLNNELGPGDLGESRQGMRKGRKTEEATEDAGSEEVVKDEGGRS